MIKAQSGFLFELVAERVLAGAGGVSPPIMNRRHRAFSLIEVAIVIAMVGIIGAAAASVCSLVLSTMKNTRTLAALGVRAQLPMLYLQTELQRAGGNGIPPAAAVIVEDNCAERGKLPSCGGNDRVTIFTAIQGPVCKATRVMSKENIFTFKWEQGGCCLRTELPADTPPVAADGTINKAFVGHLMLQTLPTAPTPMWRPIYAETASADSCEFLVQDLLKPAMLPPGSMEMTDNQTVDAVLVEVRTFYVDDQHNLWLHLDNTMPPNPGEPEIEGRRALVADRIYDFQMALGFDGNNNGFYENAEWAHFGSAPNPASLGKAGPGLIWFTLITGLDARTGHGGGVVRSPLRGPTVGIGGPGTQLADMHLRSTSLHVAPLNGALTTGFSFSSNAP